METSAVQGTNPLYQKYGYGTGSGGKTAEDNVFLTLLTTQLKNQNPLEPLENGQFIQQMTALAQVEEQQTLNAKLSNLLAIQEVVAGQNAFTQSASLVGKYVSYQDPESGEEKQGHVGGVKLTDAGLHLTIGEDSVPLSLVTGILDQPPATSNEDQTDDGGPAVEDDANDDANDDAENKES